jgi:hypothetical protein
MTMANARTQRTRGVMEGIRQILFQDWDPLGVKDNQKLSDEYDSCIAPVYRLLVERASAKAIVNCLFRLERDLGMPAKSKEHLLPIAHKLLGLNVKVGTDAA